MRELLAEAESVLGVMVGLRIAADRAARGAKAEADAARLVADAVPSPVAVGVRRRRARWEAYNDAYARWRAAFAVQVEAFQSMSAARAAWRCVEGVAGACKDAVAAEIAVGDARAARAFVARALRALGFDDRVAELVLTTRDGDTVHAAKAAAEDRARDLERQIDAVADQIGPHAPATHQVYVIHDL